IPLLIDFLGDRDRLLREYVGNALVSMGKASVPALLKVLKDKNPHKREAAVRCLAQLLEPPALVPLLIETLKDDDAAVRTVSAGALKFVGPENKRAIFPLIKL